MAHNHQIFDSFLQYNKQQSAKFTEPEQVLRRMQYRAKYPVQISATKCMDGRVNISDATMTPVGIIQPFSTLGGKFEVGSHFSDVLLEQIIPATKEGRDSIVLVTYHWSRGLKERGCKGFHCEVDHAKDYTKGIIRDIEIMFGRAHEVVYPIQVGIETDEDALVLHGSNGETFDLSTATSGDPDSLRSALRRLFPDMNGHMIESLIPLCVGNIQHISEIRAANRPISDLEHKENILGLGRGFDGSHQVNQMLIVGPYSFDLVEPIVVAGKLLLDNIRSGRISDKDGVALITAATYDEIGPYEMKAMLKARDLASFALRTLEQNVSELMPYLDVRSGVVYKNTRLFTPIDLEG